MVLVGRSGCGSFKRLSSRLKAGLGIGRSRVAVAIVLCGRFAGSNAAFNAAWLALLYGERAALATVVEKGLADLADLADRWAQRRVSMLAGCSQLHEWENKMSGDGKGTRTMRADE